MLHMYLTYLLLPAPEIQELIKIVVSKVRAEWQYIAYAMGYKVYEVNNIHKDCCDFKERCVKLFTKWLTTSSDKTWQTLLDHIKQVDDLTAVVEEIEMELTQCKKLLIFIITLHILIVCKHIRSTVT